jgi:uncharacterized protein YaeQ
MRPGKVHRLMALPSTIHNVILELSDVDRGVYETLDLKLAMHPSESPEYLVTRLLAYALEYAEGIEFAPGGLSSPDQPAVLVKDLTGKITAWIEAGTPGAERLHRAAKLADRVAVYTHKDVRNYLGLLAGAKIHRAAEIPIYSFGRGFIDQLAAKLQRRMRISLSVTEHHLYLDIDGAPLSTVVEEQRLLS